MNEQSEFNLMLILSLWSLDIGFQNLALNKQQVDGLMREMTDKQDTLLEKIICQNNEIIALLRGKNEADKRNN